MIVIHLVETRYTRVCASTHLSEWGKPKNIDVTRDFDDDDGNEDLYIIIDPCIQFSFGRF